MMNHGVAILDKTDAVFNVGDVLRCRTQNNFNVVVSHAIGEWLKFRINMQMCNGESCSIAALEGLIE